MFDRSHGFLTMSFVGALTAIGCTPVPLRSPVNRAGLVALSANTDSAFSRCAQATIPIDTVTPAAEPFGLVDPRNPNHLVISWLQRARFGVTVLRSAASFDGGESWPYVTTLPLTSCATRTSFPFHTAGDPWLAVGGNGPIYASGLAFTEDSGSGIAVTTSHDGGRSWHTPIIAMTVAAKQGQYDNSSVAVDPRNAAVAFVLSTRTEWMPDSTQVGLVVLSKTSDGGRTWSTPRAISPKSTGAAADLPQMAIDPVGGRLFVVYTSGAGGAIWLLVSADAGESWSAPTQVVTFTPLKSPPRFPRSNVVLRVGEDVARLAIDHPDRVDRLAVLDIIPTGDVLARTSVSSALTFWPWSLLSQAEPLPERLILADPAAVVDDALGQWGSDPACFPAALRAAYVAALGNPATVHAVCEEYRASVTIDDAMDRADQAAGRRIACPTLALWSKGGGLDRWYESVGGPLGIWRQWAPAVAGRAIAGGHFFPEQNPDETIAELAAFFSPRSDGGIDSNA